MDSQPQVVLLHTAAARRYRDTSDHVSKLNAHLPDVNISVCNNMAESLKQIETADIALASRLPQDLLERAKRLKWVQALSSGVDFYDLEELEKRGIILTNMSGIHSEPIAEQILSFMLAFERNLIEGFELQKENVWKRYRAGELQGKTVGIIGVGAIGGRVAELSKAFNMEVIGLKRNLETIPSAVDKPVRPDQLFTLLEEADYVVVSCPLTDDTRGLIGSEELKAMKGSSVLINIARGGVIDEDALVDCLQQGGIHGAALDVFEHEPLPRSSALWDLPNVIVTPHMAGSTPHKRDRIAEVFKENYAHYVNGDIENLNNRII